MRFVALGFALVVAVSPAAAQNLLPDPAFTSGVSGWEPVGASSTTIRWLNSPGPDGIPGIARLQISGPGFGFAQACLPIVGGRAYSWGASFIPRSAIAQVILEFYPNGSCQGNVLVGETFGPPTFGPNAPGLWQFDPGPDVTAPATAGSVLFRIMASTGANGAAEIDADNVYFGPQGMLPPGAEAIPALSRSMLLALSLALLLGGGFLLGSRTSG